MTRAQPYIEYHCDLCGSDTHDTIVHDPMPEWVRCPLHMTKAQPLHPAARMARDFSLWLDSTYPPDLDPEAHMRRRVGKVCEESGEVHEALGALWGENPRKPRGTVEDVIKELADCAGAALGAIEHLTGHEGRSLDIMTARVREVCLRAGIEVEGAT